MSKVSHRLGVEDIEPNHYVAWVFDAPGVFGSGRTREEAIEEARRRVGGTVDVAEEHRSWLSRPDYIVNAFFQDDLRPVTADEVDQARALLDRTLEEIVRAFERWPDPEASRIVGHVSQAEWWYFDRLRLSSPREGLPDEPLERLRAIHQRTVEILPRLVNERRVAENVGEQWSARKILRRTLWHRQDHLRQLERA